MMISQASSEQELCVVVDQNFADAAVASLNKHFEQEVRLGLVDNICAKSGFSIVNLVLGKDLQRPGYFYNRRHFFFTKIAFLFDRCRFEILFSRCKCRSQLGCRLSACIRNGAQCVD